MYGATGLGQTDDQVLGARDILLNMMRTIDQKLVGLANTPPVSRARSEISRAASYLQSGINLFYNQGDNRRALDAFTAGITRMHEASKIVNSLRPEDRVAAQEQAALERGSSFTYQVGQTIGGSIETAMAEPVAQALEVFSPAAAEAVRSNWWVIPILGGGLLVLFLRR